MVMDRQPSYLTPSVVGRTLNLMPSLSYIKACDADALLA